MKSSSFRRTLALTAALLLAVSCLVIPSAAAGVTGSINVSSYGAWMTANSNNTITVEFFIDGTTTMAQIGVSSIEFQEKTGPNTYITRGNGSSCYKYDNITCSGWADFSATKGKTYRAIVNYYVVNYQGGSSTGASVTGDMLYN